MTIIERQLKAKPEVIASSLDSPKHALSLSPLFSIQNVYAFKKEKKLSNDMPIYNSHLIT